MNDEQRIEIETKLAYQERMISELNAIVYDQQKTIDNLIKMLESLKSRFSEFSATMTVAEAKHEKPPHY